MSLLSTPKRKRQTMRTTAAASSSTAAAAAATATASVDQLQRTPQTNRPAVVPKSPFWQTLSPLADRLASPKTPYVSRNFLHLRSPAHGPGVASPTPSMRNLARTSFGMSPGMSWAPDTTPAHSRAARSRLTAPGDGSQKLQEAVDKQLSQSTIGVHLPLFGASALVVTGGSADALQRPFFAKGLDFGAGTLPPHEEDDNQAPGANTQLHYDSEDDEVEAAKTFQAHTHMGLEDDMSDAERGAAAALVSLSPQRPKSRRRHSIGQVDEEPENPLMEAAVSSSSALAAVAEASVSAEAPDAAASLKSKGKTKGKGKSKSRSKSKGKGKGKKESPLRKGPAAASTGSAAIPHKRSLGDKMRSPTGGKQQRQQNRRKRSNGRQRGCNCKKSKCLKLYCECFARQGYCGPGCSCAECCNKQEFEEKRQKAIESISSRDANAFFRAQNMTMNSVKGCHCKKSHCLKKYCECFQAGVGCSDMCKCKECQNRSMPSNNHDGRLGPASRKTLLSQNPPPRNSQVQLAAVETQDHLLGVGEHLGPRTASASMDSSSHSQLLADLSAVASQEASSEGHNSEAKKRRLADAPDTDNAEQGFAISATAT